MLDRDDVLHGLVNAGRREASGFQGVIAPVQPRRPGLGHHYILEDQGGYPIECPLCGQVDRWQRDHDAPTGALRGFVCRHPVAVGPSGVTHRVASVGLDQVGGFLDRASLAPAAA